MHDIVFALETISESAKNTFGTFSDNQINWKPAENTWSIGQCLEHIIKSNKLYYEDFDRIIDGTRKNSFYENYSPLSGFFGRFIAKSQKNDMQKSKTIAHAVPPSQTESNIVEKFIIHQTGLIEKINLMRNADWQKIKLTSPFLAVATYSLADCFQIILEHEKRHFRQAERVIGDSNFPK